MSNIEYHLIEGAGSVDNVVALDPETGLRQADSNHPHWNAILDGLAAGDAAVFELFDVQKGLIGRLTSLSDRVSWDGENILFDGDVQATPIANHLKRCLEAGVKDYQPVVRFWEKVSTNPDERSREQLFTWLQSHDFTITEDGDILGYKSVNEKDGTYYSVHSGTAYVDGERIDGVIPNKPGTVVTMPRARVQNDPNTACHYGLHVGDWSYVHDFFKHDAILEVHVNPRDVVSIPNDHSQTKMRCCRYTVVRTRENKSNAPIAGPTEWRGDVGYLPK